MVPICTKCGKYNLHTSLEATARICRSCQGDIASDSFRRQYEPSGYLTGNPAKTAADLQTKLDAALARVRELEADKSNLTIHNNNLASQHESARLALWAEQDVSRKLGEMLEQADAEKEALQAELGRYKAFVSHERLILAHANPFELPDGTIGHRALDDDQRARLKRINDFLMGLRIEATGQGGDGGLG